MVVAEAQLVVHWVVVRAKLIVEHLGLVVLRRLHGYPLLVGQHLLLLLEKLLLLLLIKHAFVRPVVFIKHEHLEVQLVMVTEVIG